MAYQLQKVQIYYSIYRKIFELHLCLPNNKYRLWRNSPSKTSFYCISASHNISVRHYYCDNGIFDITILKKAITRSNQTIYFCSVNTHHQNDKTERLICGFTDRARTSLFIQHDTDQELLMLLYHLLFSSIIFILRPTPPLYLDIL